MSRIVMGVMKATKGAGQESYCRNDCFSSLIARGGLTVTRNESEEVMTGVLYPRYDWYISVDKNPYSYR